MLLSVLVVSLLGIVISYYNWGISTANLFTGQRNNSDYANTNDCIINYSHSGIDYRLFYKKQVEMIPVICSVTHLLSSDGRCVY